MHVLALDTTTRAGSVAIVNDAGVLVEHVGDAARSHTERLPTDVLRALEACALSLADVDVFAIACGPGSFTGLRTGIATLQGFALALGRRMVAVSALTALGEAAGATLDRGAVVGAWMDAYRRDVFSALFEIGAGPACAIGHLRELDPPSVADPRAILDQWTGRGTAPVAIAGDGAVLYSGILEGRARVVSPPPLASFIGRLALARATAGETIDPAAVQPLYVRRPDVEAARDACRS